MEGEQKYEIPVNSTIDTETSSQLSPVSSPTLSYNPQEFQGGVLPTSLRYEHDGWVAGMHVHEFPTHDNIMLCHTTHVETGEECDIAKIEMDKEWTLVKQQWDTSLETEYWWWIDETHILQLTKHSFNLYHKLSTPHHWNGDNWELTYTVSRTTILSSQTYQYLCSSSADGSDVKFIAINYLDVSHFKLRVWSRLVEGLDNVREYICSIEHKQLGISLPSSDPLTFCSYLPLNCSNFISQVHLSATSISSQLLLGFALDKGLNQWCLRFSGGEIAENIMGYGYVGVKGMLTGGEIPESYCDSHGLLSTFTVHDISYLANLTNTHGLDISGEFAENAIVGTPTQHWFIQREINRIVSHMEWNGSGFTPIYLILNNNYSAIYTSPSFYSGYTTPLSLRNYSSWAFIGDALDSLVQGSNPADAMNSITGGLSAILGKLGGVADLMAPHIWFLDPKIGALQMLQMSVGQYAYVWYNSTNHTLEKDLIKESRSYSDMSPNEQKNYNEQSKEVKAVTDDQLSFDKQFFSQSASIPNPFKWEGNNTYGFWAILMLALGGAGLDKLIGKADDLVVNKLQGHTSSGADTTDRSFGQLFLENVVSLATTETGYTGRHVNVTNNVTALKTLDMFYSVGNNTQCWAGEGHVSHTMQAQCVSQSITTTRLNGYLIGLLCFLPGLTKLECHIKAMAFKGLADGLGRLQSNLWSVVGGGTVIEGGPLTPPVGVFLPIVAGIAAGCAAMADGYNNMGDSMVEMLKGILPSAKTINYGNVDRNDITMEAKHSYGEKSCTWMYPCFGCDGGIDYTNERVEAVVEDKDIQLYLKPFEKSDSRIQLFNSTYSTTTAPSLNNSWRESMEGKLWMQTVKCRGRSNTVKTPDKMAVVEGCSTFLPESTFRNERVGVSSPVFGFPPIQDYIVDEKWELGMTCTAGKINAVSVKDTKIIDGRYSNIYISPSFCGVASSYCAIEVKKGIQPYYLRPYAVTPNILAINTTGLNVFSNNIAYHGFDGYSTRIVQWTGGSGIDKERRNFLYTFIADGNIKLSNNYPANVYFGYFKGSSPTQAIPARCGLTNYVYNPRDLEGMNSIVNNEYRAMERYSIPIFTELVGILPVVVRTYGSFVLKRYSGVTSLCTELRETDDGRYKMEGEVDFAIRNDTFRVTPEYINSTRILDSRTDVKAIWAKLGLKFLGSDTGNGYFYNQSTHQWYIFNGGELVSRAVWSRYKNLSTALYDFLSQDVAFVCDASTDLLDISPYKADTEDMVNVFNTKGVVRNIYPPIETIMSEDSGFLLRTFPCGITYQGPNRVIINRSIWQDYMLEDVKRNKRKWLRVPRESYHPWRQYPDKYERVDIQVRSDVKGWTHNPFAFITSPLGVSEDVDCIYEWYITFQWTPEMDLIYEQNEYVCVSLAAKTFCPGGITTQRPTHLFFTRELFTHSDNSGYYTFCYRSNGGAGNREQLFMWSDGYIAVSKLEVAIKQITGKRTSRLVIQKEVEGMIEI